ncbi:carbohydrate ABC transporter permease [Couchioplanes caeruleus]|uniref:Sugar ABC transporter permease n=2 Tax=Couchioplanes caeruleus TaxID=56438 RepID=A0A1K0GS39_9ACTN|nr:sugar ABC transporter permease [Couchioplanes caeruleus]OJF14036.1 sugar ABC transporter permease [Couchioplanes caeruleus subsp. caeruleus]ROP30561.1 carbohydrate ABC transporter membrane protein 1 (CUT1 family) [Couchioplanes caeruleus]
MTDVIARSDEKAGAVPPQASAPARGGARERWVRRAPLLPALVFAIIVTQVPFLVTLYLSTLGWNALRPGRREFVGLDNYVSVLTDSRLRAALANTVLLTAGAVIFSMVLGLMLAMLLDRRFAGRAVVRTLLITPFLVMPIAAALLWKHALYNPAYGLINGLFGGSSDWISSYPKAAVVATLVWQWTPFMMLILLAGLQSQSEEVLEAARVDGAHAWQIFTRMTLPHLRQYLELGALLGSIYLVNTFDSVFSITQGGPGTATTNLPYEIYLTTFRKFEYGEASAAGVIVVLLTIIVATFALRVISTLFRMEEGR